MQAPHTFLYDYNRNGIPWRANEYICPHGYESQTCGVDWTCAPVGLRMVSWLNNLPGQWRDRAVVRDRLINE